MSRPLSLSVPAQAELREAVAWYEARAPGLGREFLNAARTCFRRISTHPGAGSLIPDAPPEASGARRLRLWRFPYAVVYIELKTELRVLALAHDRRAPGYWRNR